MRRPVTPAERRRAANGLLDALRSGHDVPAADVADALVLTGDIPELSDAEAGDYTTLRRRDQGGIHTEDSHP